jgi:hypothetical protein
MRDGWLTVTVVLLALMRRRPAGTRVLLAMTRVLLAMTRVPLAVTQRRSAVNAVPHNFRSVCKHGMTISGAESAFGMHETVFRTNR